jgi:hypothetical protein
MIIPAIKPAPNSGLSLLQRSTNDILSRITIGVRGSGRNIGLALQAFA